MTKLKTMVAAPGIKSARAISSKFHTRTQMAVQQLPVWLRPFAVSFIGTSVVILTGAGVFAAVNFVYRSVISITVPTLSLPQIPLGGKPSTQPVSDKQANSKLEKISNRRQKLEIPSGFFTRTVDEIFYTSKPELKRRVLTGNPEDAALREEWYGTAEELLNKIERANLSVSARKKLGSYTKQDYETWGKLARSGKLGKYKTIEQLRTDTYKKFEPLFPGQERGKLNQQTFLQIWYAIASDKVGDR
jgi:hypothetical protein